jgi:hypothetical protein
VEIVSWLDWSLPVDHMAGRIASIAGYWFSIEWLLTLLKQARLRGFERFASKTP